jgi:chemotaxis protein MotA
MAEAKGGKFEFGTISGILLGFGAILGGFILEGGALGALILIPALIIVFGGTLATVLIGTSRDIFLKLPKIFMLACFPPKCDAEGTIQIVIDYSTIARKGGLLALESGLGDITNPFLKKMLGLAVDGTSPEVIREIAEIEMSYIAERHNANAGVFGKMGGYSPTMGIIGTVMGLIKTLAEAGEGDSSKLIESIASAFIATLWGVFMANVIWLPIADRLKSIHAEEKLSLEIIIEGVLAIQAGESPSLARTKLCSMLPASKQAVEER